MGPKNFVTYYVEYISPQETTHRVVHALPVYGHETTTERLINDVRDELYKIEFFKDSIEISKAIHDENFWTFPKYELCETIEFSFNTLCDLIFDKFNPQKQNGKIEISAGTWDEFRIEVNAENLSIIHTCGDFSHDKYRFGRAIDSYCSKFLFSKIAYNNYNL